MQIISAPLTRASESSGETLQPAAGPWIMAAAAAAIAVGGAMLAAKGDGRAGADAAIFWTGRLAFAFFWPSYVGSALATLFGRRFQPLKRRGRSLGLAFAAVIAVHLSLVAWLTWIGDAPPLETFIVFGIAAGWTFALAACSIERVSDAIGRAGWWVLRNIGMNYIAFVFALDFLRPQHPLTPMKIVEYFPFAGLSLLGPMLRLLAWLKPVLYKGDARRAGMKP